MSCTKKVNVILNERMHWVINEIMRNDNTTSVQIKVHFCNLVIIKTS